MRIKILKSLGSLALLAFLASFLFACASSRPYRPLPWEAELYATHSKAPFPGEANTESDTGKSLHWLGVIDTFWVEGNDSLSTLYLRAEHKYWDYIEDFSIQREKMFVSPLGTGPFIYRKILHRRPLDTTYLDMRRLAEKNNLGLFYGRYIGRENDLPTLDGGRVRFVHRQYYSTRIWSYEMRQDSTGRHRMENLKILKSAAAGINDPEDKEFE